MLAEKVCQILRDAAEAIEETIAEDAIVLTARLPATQMPEVHISLDDFTRIFAGQEVRVIPGESGRVLRINHKGVEWYAYEIHRSDPKERRERLPELAAA